MPAPDYQQDATFLINAVAGGDREAADRLLELVYRELRNLAEVRMGQEKSGQTLQPTALVHEAYLRLLGPGGGSSRWNSQGHFFGAAAEAMRRILIDRARAKGAVKRGGMARAVKLNPDQLLVNEVPDGLLDLDEALTRLAEDSPVEAELVKLRFFAGLTMSEAAEALGISDATASRYWAYARVWLYNALAS